MSLVRYVSALAAVLLALLPVPVQADVYDVAATTVRYNVDATAVTYCTMQGPNGNPWGDTFSGPARITSAGASTTVTSEIALSGSMSPLAVQDVLWVRGPSTGSSVLNPFARGLAAVVTAKASGNSITVDPTIDWSNGFQYNYLKTVCGTTDGDGWVDVSSAQKISFSIHYEQGDLDNLSWRFECKQSAFGSPTTVVYPSEGDNCGQAGTLASGFCDFATAGVDSEYTWEESGAWSWCRIGIKMKTSETNDTGANRERVTSSIAVTRTQ